MCGHWPEHPYWCLVYQLITRSHVYTLKCIGYFEQMTYIVVLGVCQLHVFWEKHSGVRCVIYELLWDIHIDNGWVCKLWAALGHT